jgi:hypothetical protein
MYIFVLSTMKISLSSVTSVIDVCDRKEINDTSEWKRSKLDHLIKVNLTALSDSFQYYNVIVKMNIALFSLGVTCVKAETSQNRTKKCQWMKTSKHKCRENVNEKISNNKSRKKCQRRKSRKINVEEKKRYKFYFIQ